MSHATLVAAPPPPGGQPVPASWPGWAARVVALLVGAVLGMAVGHGLAWRTAPPLPDDAETWQLAITFAGERAGVLSRADARWAPEPGGWRGLLLGHRELHAAEVSVRFDAADSAEILALAHVRSVAQALRSDGWQQVEVNGSYASLRAHRDGLVLGYGPVLGDPHPTSNVQQVLGAVLPVRHATPQRAPLGLLLGALAGGALATGGLAALQPVLRRRPPPVRRLAVGLSATGAVLLGPATLAAAGLLYLFLTDDLVQEPLWYAYSLPLTRPAALLGGLSLLAAVVITITPRRMTT